MNDRFTFPLEEGGKRKMVLKGGIRVLGVAESFDKTSSHSFVVGVIMRGDLRIDGFGFCNPTVGGTDSTNELVRMYNSISRQDIHAWLIGGCIISWFNAIDVSLLSKETGLPVICISYEDSPGIEKYVREYFEEDWEDRMSIIEKLGERKKAILDSGYKVYITCSGIDHKSAVDIINQFTCDGRVPEPIRVARKLAAEIRKRFEPITT